MPVCDFLILISMVVKKKKKTCFLLDFSCSINAFTHYNKLQIVVQWETFSLEIYTSLPLFVELDTHFEGKQ